MTHFLKPRRRLLRVGVGPHLGEGPLCLREGPLCLGEPIVLLLFPFFC